MKTVALTGVFLVSIVLCCSGLTAVSMAATEWLCNGKAGAEAKECLVLLVNLEVLLLKDMSNGSEVDCPVGSVTGEGFVGPGAADETRP